MNKVLPKNYFFSRNTVKIAKSLLGKFLVRRYPHARNRSGQDEKTAAYMITEVEAYDGPKDKASHAHKGITKRNKIMFGKAGHWYVYFTYGMHWMLNIVTGPEKYPAAILIRGFENISGPARLTKALRLNGDFNATPATKKSGLWIEDRGIKISKIASAPRIGVAYAGPIWSRKKYRFYII